MSTLPYKIVQSDGGELKVLATVADETIAYTLFQVFCETLSEDQGSYPTIWVEEWNEDRWVIVATANIEEDKRFLHRMMEGNPSSNLLWRHIGKAEQRFIIRAMEDYIDGLEGGLHSQTRQAFVDMHNNCSYGHSDFIAQVEEHLFKPWEKLDKMKNLVSFLRDRPIIVETHVLIPDQL